MTITTRELPRPAPARVLALGAWLKNAACLLDGRVVHDSLLHGDLGTPEACIALERSAEALLGVAGGRVDAVAHDLHPDFPSTRLAQDIAARLGVPAVGVQHHHAHVAVVQAEHGIDAAYVGLALDGVGLGSDGQAWGGELLRLEGAAWQRLGHLTPLALPGGDVAAREPWRMAAAALHALGRGDEIVPRFAPVVGERLARGVRTMLERSLNCPPTTSAGRWFDAVAGLAGLSVRQAAEAEAAIALESAASAWIAAHGAPAAAADGMDLRRLVAQCIATPDAGEAAARFHAGLAQGLADAAITAGAETVALAGGCFYNRVLAGLLTARLQASGRRVLLAQGRGPGDAGLALGQAWVAACTLGVHHEEESAACA
jgi:hydrogenase maturation protein HypF